MIQSKTALIALSLLLVFGLSGCDKPNSAEQAGKSLDKAASDIGDSVDEYGDKMSEQGAKSAQAWEDTEVTTKVKAALLGEPGLKSMKISVDTVEGVVTLTGTVDSQASSDTATARTMAISGVQSVVNQLEVTSTQ
ncbi:BON domain-containing protein [Aeromonas bivalvium]|uniref:BON domain-containing protein n=1 Tax=Aeromonas bivalvium TaxID=440079 RepID=UPI0038CF74DF